MTFHRWVPIFKALDYCRLGWLPSDTLRNTHHGEHSVHVVWLCSCQMVVPR